VDLDPSMALPTVMFIDIWQWAPMMALILLAGPTSPPRTRKRPPA
jgi:multiple sugar transport system permease protein